MKATLLFTICMETRKEMLTMIIPFLMMLLLPHQASGSHFRGGTITWSVAHISESAVLPRSFLTLGVH